MIPIHGQPPKISRPIPEQWAIQTYTIITQAKTNPGKDQYQDQDQSQDYNLYTDFSYNNQDQDQYQCHGQSQDQLKSCTTTPLNSIQVKETKDSSNKVC